MKTGLEFNHASKHCRCFPSLSFCGKIVTEEQNLIVSHENNMLQLYYTQWSWNCRGCWHQSCLQLPPQRDWSATCFKLQDMGALCCCFFSLLPVSRLGNLHSCRLPEIGALLLVRTAPLSHAGPKSKKPRIIVEGSQVVRVFANS